MKENLKRIIFIIMIIIILIIVTFLGYVAYQVVGNPGKTNNVEISIGNSSKFSKEEIESAMQVAMKKFKGFKGCDLKQLWYNDELNSETAISRYVSQGVVTAENNVIILYFNFYAGPGSEDSLAPNNDYTNWQWILIRDSKSSKWKVHDFGDM
ncbi:MAG: DUF4829 domain-containing protein [Oscillospiraceae bacterium]|nr:DUF4829 domain-containing protein [Oscillospiraceae bacterium]